MKNLFDFATKELSQDAFLRWLFANYNDPHIGKIGKELIAKMVNLNSEYCIQSNQIDNVAAYGQYERMDIVVDFTINEKLCVLILEDKTTSSEHSNQLMKYKNIVLNKWNTGKNKDRPSFFVFYKTHKIDDGERERIINSGWKEFSFDLIYEFWKEYAGFDNLIINQYASHIIKRWEDSHNVERPDDNNIDKWIGYFEQTIKPNIGVECDSWVSSTFYGYAYLCARPKGKGDNPLPYIEIRSRDCLDDNFEARILLYDVDEKYLDPIRDIIRERELNGIFKGNYGAKRKKQVAHTLRKTDKFKIKSDEDFINLTNLVINEYLEIIKKL